MRKAMQMMLPIMYTDKQCHFKGCTEPVVCSSVKQDKYVCDQHNNLEWARALARGKDGYWQHFGRQWLVEMGETR